MTGAKDVPGIKIIMYLATQSDYVSVHDILEDKFSGFSSRDEIKAALKGICDALDIKTENGEFALYRLPVNFDGYRDVFGMVRGSEQVYNFLASNYSHALFDDAFIREALVRVIQTPYFVSLSEKYPENMKPGDALITMLSQQPGFSVIEAMISVSPAVAEKLLFPETMSKYEMTHLKTCLDLTFMADMVKRAPPGTMLSVKYEVISKGMINLEMRGGTGIP